MLYNDKNPISTSVCLGCGIQSDEESSVYSLLTAQIDVCNREMVSRLPYRHTNIIVTVGYVLMFRCQYKNTMPSNEQIQSKGNLRNVLFESLTLNILSKQKKACHIFRAELLACVSQLTDPLGYNNNKSR